MPHRSPSRRASQTSGSIPYSFRSSPQQQKQENDNDFALRKYSEDTKPMIDNSMFESRDDLTTFFSVKPIPHSPTQSRRKLESPHYLNREFLDGSDTSQLDRRKAQPKDISSEQTYNNKFFRVLAHFSPTFRRKAQQSNSSTLANPSSQNNQTPSPEKLSTQETCNMPKQEENNIDQNLHHEASNYTRKEPTSKYPSRSSWRHQHTQFRKLPMQLTEMVGAVADNEKSHRIHDEVNHLFVLFVFLNKKK